MACSNQRYFFHNYFIVGIINSGLDLIPEGHLEVILGSKSDLNLAVEKAKKAFEEWSNKPPIQRARIIFKYKELVEKNSEELIKYIVSEHGKVFEDARGSLTRGLEVVEFACGIPQMLKEILQKM